MKDNKYYEFERVSIRLAKERPLLSTENISSPIDAINVLGSHLSDYDREVLCIINLDSKNRPINCSFCSIGGIDYTVSEPREIFKSAILSNAAKVMLMHNHPSGIPTPSKEDIKITDRLTRCGDLLGIPVMDHIIVGDHDMFYSLAAQKQFKHLDTTYYETNIDIVAGRLRGNIYPRSNSKNKLAFSYIEKSENEKAFDIESEELVL